jgi:hypothetical protein
MATTRYYLGSHSTKWKWLVFFGTMETLGARCSYDAKYQRNLSIRFKVQVANYLFQHIWSQLPAFSWWVPCTLKKSTRIISKIRTKNVRLTEKFGIAIPRTVSEALQFDKDSGTTYWQDTINKEMKNVQVAFNIQPKGQKSPPGHQYITCHIIFDVKLVGIRIARHVAGGQLTDTRSSIIFSTVEARDSVRILLLVAVLNRLDVEICSI